jgi:nitrate/nitrite-specific signal transduction histidine kinase
MSVFFLITPCMFYIHTLWPGGIFTIQNQISAHIFSALTVTALLLTSSLVIALHEDQAHVFETLGNVLKEKDLQMLIDSGIQTGNESAYSQYLHAEVQSQLLACKLLLLKAAESDFTLFSPEVTQQIVDRLEKIKQPYERPAARIPTERVRELATSWRGLAEISYELSQELSEVHSYSDVVAQLIEESVINAIRHGKAKKINIKSFSTDGLINVVITDNGHLKDGQTGSGLGTILFDTFAKSWRIARENDTTVVTFSVSTENQKENRKG